MPKSARFDSAIDALQDIGVHSPQYMRDDITLRDG